MGQSYITSIGTTVVAIIHALWLTIKIRPQVVFSQRLRTDGCFEIIEISNLYNNYMHYNFRSFATVLVLVFHFVLVLSFSRYVYLSRTQFM